MAPLREISGCAQIDFFEEASTTGFEITAKRKVGPVALAQCTFQPSSGSTIRFSQFVVGVHTGPMIHLEWRPAHSDRHRSEVLTHGRVLLADAEVPAWKQWKKSRSMFAVAFEKGFVQGVWERSFEGRRDCTIQAAVGISDPVIGHLAALSRRELNDQDVSGRLYVESIASALITHLGRSYGDQTRPKTHSKGGLGPSRFRRVIEYIDAHLREDVGLLELADLAGLTPQYFGEAFKAETGVPPHRFIVEQRIQRAQALLTEKDRSIANIAYEVGFSSQSQLTRHFQRVTGITPAHFRRMLG